MTMTAGGLAKLMEETGELLQVAGKKLAYFHTDEHPDGKGSLKERMEDEMADVIAIIDFVTESFNLDRHRIQHRTLVKRRIFQEWDESKDDIDNEGCEDFRRFLSEWTCHICKERRPDERISVYTTDLSEEWDVGSDPKRKLPPGSVTQNVRYCNDKPACIEAAKTWRL